MKLTTKIIAVSVLLFGVGGCASTERHLMFVSSDTFGLDVTASTTDTGAGFTVGYKGNDFTVMPTYVGYEDEDGNISDALEISSYGAGLDSETDALSVFASFNANSPLGIGQDGESDSTFGLSKFFATGLSARQLASGVACALIVSEIKGETNISPRFDPASCLNKAQELQEGSPSTSSNEVDE